MLEITGLAGASAVQQALMISRGGAAIVAASAVSSLAEQTLLKVRGGAASGNSSKSKAPIRKAPAPKKSTTTAAKKPVVAPKKKTNSNSNAKAPLVAPLVIAPRAKAILYMAVAMSLHYLGYSLARPITISLFTSRDLGYGGYAAAFPFAMAFVSPMSLALLLWYGRVLDKHGPGGALNRSTWLCATVVSASAVAIRFFQNSDTKIMGIAAAKFVSGPLFVFRESYVQLLTSQYWSFMASALTPSQSAKWFGPIAGLTSISSAAAGFYVSEIIEKIGIAYALLGTGATLLLSLVAVHLAYSVAEEHGFAPSVAQIHGSSKSGAKKGAVAAEENMFRKATNLFNRVPILWKLFVEILASQGLATILNVIFVARLQRSIPDDAERAGWVGKFFSTINLVTMVLQFGILPPLLTYVEPKVMWRIVPLVAMVCTTFQATQEDPSLYIVSATLAVMKILEYSARRMLDEMVFVPLDFESRFVGKEVIGVFGYRFGKSLMSLGLSGLTAIFGNLGIQEYSILSAIVNVGWFKTAWSLSNFVPTRAEAQEMYTKQNGKKGSGRQ